MNNLVVQLLLKTGTFSSDLKTARGQVQQFQNGCKTAGKSLDAFGKAIGIDIGMLTKFGGAVGVAVAAGKGLKAVIDSNQKSADFFQSAIYSAKTAVSELAYAVGTFDFSNFQNGLSDLIRRAREAAGAIDQLGNTLMSYNVVQAKANAAVAKARAAQKNPNLSQDEKKALADAAEAALAELRETTSVAIEDFQAAIVAEVNAKGAKISGEGAMVLIDKYLTLDGKRIRDEVKESMKVAQDAYNQGLADLNRRYGPKANTGFSNNFGSFTYSDNTWKNNEAYKRELAALNDQYKELFVYNTLLVKEQDKELEKLGQQRAQTYNLEASLYNMEGTLNTVEKKIDGTTGATKKETEAIKESLEYWKKIQQEAQKNRDNSVLMSDAWKHANAQLDEALNKIELITAAMERAKTESKYGTDILTPITGQNLTGKAENKMDQGLAGDTKRTIADIERSLASYQEKQKNTFDPELLAHYNQRIKELRAELDRMNNLGISTPTPDDKAVDKWDEFNNAMANTSTIVSNLAETFQEGMGLSAASVLKMVSTSLPAVSSLITAVAALAGVEATEKAVASSKHWIEAIAAVAALGATVAAAIGAAKSTAKFAQGGIVGGNSFTGDRVPIQANSGEMVLTKAQQARLFKLANGGGTGGSQVEFHISGTELVGVLNNANRKNNLIR